MVVLSDDSGEFLDMTGLVQGDANSTYLKSICIHLRPRISAITFSILDQFQNFKQQHIANYLMIFYEALHLTSPKIAACPISKVLACQKPRGMC